MSFRHTLQGSRYEMKYLIDEPCARAVAEFAMAYLEPDEYAATRPNYEYPVHSLYLDSPDLALCRASLHGERNRFKLRIRVYDDDPASPAFFEIKRRLDSVILKRRAAVQRSSVQRLLAGQWPHLTDLQQTNHGMYYGALQHFCGLQSTVRAEGMIFVSYVREAYVTPNENTVRVTFDRRIRTRRYNNDFSVADSPDWVDPRVNGVVLEIKFTDRFPIWVRDMVRMFNLDRRSMAKYVTCVRALSYPGTLIAQTHLANFREKRA